MGLRTFYVLIGFEDGTSQGFRHRAFSLLEAISEVANLSAVVSYSASIKTVVVSCQEIKVPQRAPLPATFQH